jgi:hypothetical protein
MWASNPWESRGYCWVVICKNTRFHNSENVMFGHKIPLAETDAFESLPVKESFLVHCDECGQENTYEPGEVVRLEFEIPNGFVAHPRFTVGS